VIVAYTDGACSGNPGPGGWAAVIATDGTREEISGAAQDTTNNRMELTAVIEALRRVPADAPVTVVTDSQYVLKGMTNWLAGWRKRGWRTATGEPVLNRDLWETLAALAGTRVSWQWVRGHNGHPENERVDYLARAHAQAGVAEARRAGSSTRAARGREPSGRPNGGSPQPGAGGRSASPGGRRGARANGTAARTSTGWPTYLSWVDGRLMRHHDWPSCERRVHGQPGARFKKCRSADEERATVAGWKLPAAALSSLGDD
jgi:ribonuclease HI